VLGSDTFETFRLPDKDQPIYQQSSPARMVTTVERR
jgi:hypothetical protein